MLRSAVWKLGRRQHVLLPLAKSAPPNWIHSRGFSHTRCKRSKQTRLSRDADAVLESSTRTVDSLPAKPAASTRESNKPIGTRAPNSTESPLSNAEDAFSTKFTSRVKNNSSPGSDSLKIDKEESVCEKGSDLTSSDSTKIRDHKRSTWLKPNLHRRSTERQTRLSKSWTNTGPEVLFRKVLEPGHDQYKWWERVATIKSYRLPVILLQVFIRHAIVTQHNGKRHILNLLPRGASRRKIIAILSSNGYTRDNIKSLLHIIQGSSDQERCNRFLDYTGHKPIFLLRYLLRTNTGVGDIFTLHDLISYIQTTYDGRRDWTKDQVFPGRGDRDFSRAQNPNLNMSPDLFGSTLQMLTNRCLQLEPRLCIKVADTAIQYILNIGDWDQPPDKIFSDQCTVFNAALNALSPRKPMLQPKGYRPFPHIWEAQRMILNMSASLERPLLLSRPSFLAVREALAGMEKNPVEIHSSWRHAQTWPPYLEPSDGMDEMTDPDENWSRSVQAGVLAQEAGFAQTHFDEALNTLQGMAPDGSPTIQQRLTTTPRRMGLWVAKIKATRNAQEAWGRFQKPPKPDMKPGVHEYAAMFAKLLQGDAPPSMNLMPGDRAMNFPIKLDVNLSDFGRARLEAPTASALYAQMRSEGIRPTGTCLDILVFHAESLELAHYYLRDSGLDFSVLTNFSFANEPDALELRKVGMPLFAAYINVLCREESDIEKPLEKAIVLSKKRFERDHHNRWWAPRVWGMVLKALTETRHLRKRPLHEQLNLYNRLLGFIETSTSLPLSTFIQFCKCLRRTVGREMTSLVSDLEVGRRSLMTSLYVPKVRDRQEFEAPGDGTTLTNQRDHERLALYSINVGVVRLKQLFQSMVDREEVGHDILRAHSIDPIDQMLARRDPVRAEDAHELMLTLAYVGEFEEMAQVLEWLVRQWSQPEVSSALEGVDQVPTFADFSDLLCVFRLLAEPMLEPNQVDDLRQMVQDSNAAWSWPDNEAVAWYRDNRVGEATRKLGHVLEWTRYWQQELGPEAESDIGLEASESQPQPKKGKSSLPRLWLGLKLSKSRTGCAV